MPDDIGAIVASAVSSAKEEVEAGDKTEAAPEAQAETTTTEERSEPRAQEESEKVEPETKIASDKDKSDVHNTEPDDEFWTPTAEELAIIDKNPEMKKVYRSMQRGMTQKAQKLSELRKSVEERVKIADWIQADPQNAARAIAAASGLNIGEAKKADTEEKVVDALEEKWTKVVGKDAAALLRPLFEETAKNIFEQVVAPYRDTTEQLARASAERGIAASVHEFGASVVERGEEWGDEISNEMATLSSRLEPARDEDGNMTDIKEYMGDLYDAVMARRMRSKGAKANLERLRRVRAESEPTAVTTAPKGEESITNDMPINDAVALAVRKANQQLGRR